MRFALLAAATTVAVVAAGCGGDVPRGRVHGTVTYKGQPVAGATVIFLASDNKTHLIDLKADGAFDVSGVALGPVKVSIQEPIAQSASKGEFDVPSSAAKGVDDEKAGKSTVPPRPKGKAGGPRLPAVYADPEKSGLGFELKTADQEWSTVLK